MVSVAENRMGDAVASEVVDEQVAVETPVADVGGGEDHGDIFSPSSTPGLVLSHPMSGWYCMPVLWSSGKTHSFVRLVARGRDPHHSPRVVPPVSWRLVHAPEGPNTRLARSGWERGGYTGLVLSRQRSRRHNPAFSQHRDQSRYIRGVVVHVR